MTDRYEPFEPCKEWDDKHPATLLRCTDCGFERHCTEDEMGICELVAPCDKRATGECVGGWLDWRWLAVGWCRNCGKIGPHDHEALRGCCSRACMLQWEHAETLGRGDVQQQQLVALPRPRSADVVPISVARGAKRRRSKSTGPNAA